MPIPVISVTPQTTSPSTFSSDMDTWISELAAWTAAVNAASSLYGVSLLATSATSLTVGTGTKLLTVSTGAGYGPGASVIIAYTTTPTNRMLGVVTSYDSGTGAMAVEVSTAIGSGTFAAWTVSASVAPDFDNQSFVNATFTNYTETTYVPRAGTSFTVSLANGSKQEFTTSGNCTITLPAPVAGKSYTLRVKYGGVHTLTWAGGGTLKWAGGVAPTATSVNGKYDTFTFDSDDAVNTFGVSGGSNA